MKIIDNILSVAKTGKTLKVIEDEQLIEKQRQKDRYNNRLKELEVEENNAKNIFEQHIDTIQEYLKTNDYDSVNKYLRLLSYQVIFAETERCLCLKEHRFVEIDSYFNILESVLKKYNEFYSSNSEITMKNYKFTVSQEEYDYLVNSPYAIAIKPSQKATFTLRERPILLNPWNNQRIGRNISNINKNNLLYPNSNIQNYYYYPLDIMLCWGGNHSQLSALLDNSLGHTSEVTYLYDLTEMYSRIVFDGINFKSIESGETIMYVSNKVEVTIGIFYEVGRLLLEHTNYFPKNIVAPILKAWEKEGEDE